MIKVKNGLVEDMRALLKEGKNVAILGAQGSGKTALTDELLQGFDIRVVRRDLSEELASHSGGSVSKSLVSKSGVMVIEHHAESTDALLNVLLQDMLEGGEDRTFAKQKLEDLGIFGFKVENGEVCAL